MRLLCYWPCALLLLFISSCGDFVAPGTSNVDEARAAWLKSRSADYSFEYAWRSSWFDWTAFRRVTVTRGVVTAVSGTQDGLKLEYQPTLDRIWDELLSSRALHQLNAANFGRDGIPIHVNYGEWASDGGVEYTVRDFRRR